MVDILGFEKILYHPEKLEKLRNNQQQFPVHVTLSLSNYCNHGCLWCSVYEYQQSKAKNMNYDTTLNWLSKAKNRGLKAIGYVGNGEPTAYPKFKEFTNEINSLGLEQGVFTNGYLLDRHMESMLNNFTYIRISLDAGSPEVHAAMHDVNPNQYPHIMENLVAIIKARKNNLPTIGVQYATHHKNISDLYNCAKQCSEIGVDYLSVKPVFNRGSVGERIEKNTLTEKEMNQTVKRARDDFENEHFKVYFRPFQIQSEEADKNILAYDRCVAGFFNLNVYEDGKVIYCGPHRISVGTMDDDLDVIEKRILKLSTKLNLSKCPGGCRYHALNHLVDSVMHPENAVLSHPNFL